MNVKLTVKNLTKVFGKLLVFKNLSFELRFSSSLVVTGRNGSGKSTLLKIIAGLLGPTAGDVIYQIDGETVEKIDWFRYVGFVAPYLQLYDEFTGYENLELSAKMRGLKNYDRKISEVLNLVGLYTRRNDLVRGYSSGMKQRLKYAFALLHEPPVLILDEPSSNLDSEGVELVWKIAAEQKEKGILIVATNEADEIKMGEEILNLDEIKTRQSLKNV